MPFRSEAQKRKFARLLETGQISQKTFDEWDKATTGKLPERVGPEKKQVNTDAVASSIKGRFGL